MDESTEGPMDPEREPLQFQVSTEGLTSEMAECITNIQNVAQQTLYHWKTFPIQLPSPVGILTRDSTPGISMRDLFIAPSFDELDQVALDSNGDAKRLDDKQLQAIRENGEFEVDSISFPNQVHRWRLSQLLQKGIIRAHHSLLDDTALALRLLIITARNRIYSHFFSLSESFMALLRGFLKLLDVVIGVPSNSAVNLEQKVWEERRKYLVAELICRRGQEPTWENYCLYIKQKCRQHSMEKYRLEDSEQLPLLPYLFQSPKGIEVDLRLYNQDLSMKALRLVTPILEQESKGWFIQFREKCVSERKARGISDEIIEKEVNVLVIDEYIRRVYNSILNSADISALGYNVGNLLVEHAQSMVFMHRALDKAREKWEKLSSTTQEKLAKDYPIHSRIGPWVRDKIREAEDQFLKDNLWTAHEEALSSLRRKDLRQAVYFLQRDLNFMKEREPILRQELSYVKNPTRYFQWNTHIWFPHNWVVTRVLHGQAEVIPTRIVDTPTNITAPRSDPSQAVYLVEKEVKRTTSTRYLFWRWVNYCMRTWCWTWNAMYIFGVLIPWCSPLSFRALFYREPFMPDLELSQVNGTLCPRKSSLTHTLCSLLHSLWRHISKSRTEFESRPDTGFLGKDMTRHLNRLWNYVGKGFFGTLAIALFFPVLCISASTCSFIIAILAPLWLPVVTLVLHLLGVLFYDFDYPDKSQNCLFIILEALIWRILIQGILQPILCLVVAFILCPVSSAFIMLYGLLRRGFRALWDGFMFHAVIKKRGRIPAGDSFIARRIAGPGLASNYYYQVKPEQVLAAFEARLELDELQAYKDEMEKLINNPQKEYSEFVSKLFRPFSAGLVREGVYKELEKEGRDLCASLKERIEKRKTELMIGLNPSIRSKVKLLIDDLKLSIACCSVMLEKFYPSHVINRLPISEEDFWSQKNLEFQNWKGLASVILCEIFSSSFLTPLEETDTTFRLEVEHISLTEYITMLASGEYRDDLDLVDTVNTAKGKIQIDAPFLDIHVFDPNYKFGQPATSLYTDRRRQPWKRQKLTLSRIEKLPIPLPIPHPSQICLFIYNRENEKDPIPIESEICKELSRAAEKVQVGPLALETIIPTDMDTRSELTATPDRLTPDHSDSDAGSGDEPVRSVVVNMSHIASAEDIVVSEDGVTYGTTV